MARWRLLARATAQQILGRLSSAAATFVALALSARALAPEGFAVIGAYLALWAILDVCIDGGSMSASLRAIAADPQRERSAIRHARAVRTALLPAAYAIVVVSAAFEDSALRLWVLGSSVALAAHLLAPATLPLHRTLQLGALAIARTAGATTTALLVAALYLNDSVEPGPYLGAFACGAVTSSVLAYRAAPKVFSGVNTILPFKPWLREALALGIAGLARTAYFWIDALLVRWLCTEHEAGNYNASYRLFNLALLLATCASASALPLFAAREASTQRELRNIGRALALGGVALACVVAFGAPWWLKLAYGTAFEDAAPTLRALCLSIAAIHVSAWTLTRLTAEARSRAIAWISFAALGLNLSLDLLWIPMHGGLGAAWATSVTEIAVVLLAYCVSVRSRGR